MMNEILWEEAEKLATRSYRIVAEEDTLSDGQSIILLRHPQLTGCKAQGFTLAEAQKNLSEARVDYLYTLLVAELPIPEPTRDISIEPEIT